MIEGINEMNAVKKRLKQTNGQSDRQTLVIELHEEDNIFATSATAKLSVEILTTERAFVNF